MWINRSDQRRERLKQYILQAYEEGSIEQLYTRVLVDGGIRWNSVYAMIERALKLRHAIDLFFLHYSHVGEGYDISGDTLTPQDWVDLGHFHASLKPFKDLTKRMEGRANKVGREGSHGSPHETIESLDVLFKALQEAGRFADDHPDMVSAYYSHAIDAARVKLEEYFGLIDAVLHIAAQLPCIRPISLPTLSLNGVTIGNGSAGQREWCRRCLHNTRQKRRRT